MAFPLRNVNDPVEGRVCGPCTACCATVEIPQLNKAERQPCEHVCERGCRLYGQPERPSDCAPFQCLWLSGHLEGDERRRPDALGLMFHFSVTRFGPHTLCWELWEGAASDPQGKYLIDKLSRKDLVAVMLWGGEGKPGRRMFVGPPHRMAQVAEFEVDFPGWRPL